jgi:hypothetical protein
MPSHLPPSKHDQSKAPSLQRVILSAFIGTSDLSMANWQIGLEYVGL